MVEHATRECPKPRDEFCNEPPSSDAPPVPQWALDMTSGTTTSQRVALLAAAGRAPGMSDAVCDVTVRSGRDAALVSVTLGGVTDWSESSLDATVQEMIGLTLGGLRATAFTEPVRLWNFLPGICDPIGDGLSRYRVFNIARHHKFASWFGDAAIRDGQFPTASCVGHHGRTLATHALGAKGASVRVDNPRQLPAFEYSTKFGPRPPCFSRAGLVEVGGDRLLLVAGTASVLGEESVHEGSLDAQLQETVANLRAVTARGRPQRSAPRAEDPAAPLQGVLATRVYHRRREDLPWLKRHLPPELAEGAEVEFVLADICREELLVEIEIVVDVNRA